VDLIAQVIGWFADPANWSGPNAIPVRIVEHLEYSLAAVALGALIAVPVGLFIGHTGRGGLFAVSIANLGRALPSLALLLMLFPLFGLGAGPLPFLPDSFNLAVAALLLLAVPPIVINTYVGLREVDRDIVEAGLGMGMTGWQILWRVELPAALPVILAGMRTAAVQVVATATLAAVVAGGGLGRYIVDGFALRDEVRLIGGALLVALLAILTERSFSLLERRTVSPGLRRPDRTIRAQHPDMAQPQPASTMGA
jgi:osmoprotectant transport system permease protein